MATRNESQPQRYTRWWIVLAVLALIGIILAIALTGGGDGGGS